jgi:hypothetical protein
MPDINTNGPFHRMYEKTSISTSQPKMVDIFPCTKKMKKMVPTYFLIRKSVKKHARHQYERSVPSNV